MLLELWQGRPVDQQLLRGILDYFQTIADEGEHEDCPKVGDQAYRLPSMNTSSAFHSGNVALFKWEFFVYTDDDKGARLSSTILHDVRQEAAMYMSCSRLARQCFELYLENSHRWDQHPLGMSSLSAGHNQLRSSYIRDSIRSGASLEPCAWLEGGLDTTGPSYFLWDRLEEKTITIQDLTDRPHYVAISYTWGRWKIDVPLVAVSGTPWQVLLNTRFNVVDLARILRLISLSHRYIWLDLLCIPQDHSRLAKIEISRPATIFREASFTIMWLNDIPKWKYFPAAIEWICLAFNRYNGFLATEPAEENNVPEEGTSVSAVEPLNIHTEQEPSSDLTINSWFTSLWTL
jgi:hypothetical protein